jgi:hypothetical protein
LVILGHFIEALDLWGGSSLYGILAIDGDVLVISWTEFFYRKVVGFSPKVGFPKINSCVLVLCSCVYCVWLIFLDLVISLHCYS